MDWVFPLKLLIYRIMTFSKLGHELCLIYKYLQSILVMIIEQVETVIRVFLDPKLVPI